jgi:hypothetical protein
VGRFIVLLAVLVALAAAAYGVYVGIRALSRLSKRRQHMRKQRELATLAPAVLNGDPLVDVVISQGKSLKEVTDILRAMMADEMYVVLPTRHSQRIRAWLGTTDQKEIDR